ncbi:MAG: hypothetical protein ACOVS5_03450 [Oligoflexus sp.]
MKYCISIDATKTALHSLRLLMSADQLVLLFLFVSLCDGVHKIRRFALYVGRDLNPPYSSK